MQNASATSKQDSAYPLSDSFASHPIENEYENVEKRQPCRQNFLPVPSPHRNLDVSHPIAPNPTPSSRPTSSSACFYIPGNKHFNHCDQQDQFDHSPSCNHHFHTHSEHVKDDNHFWRPVFFSPQPQKPDLVPAMNSNGNKKLRQSVKRAVSDGQAQIKITRNRNRKPCIERKKCMVDPGSNANKGRG